VPQTGATHFIQFTDVTGAYLFPSLAAGLYIVTVDTADPDLRRRERFGRPVQRSSVQRQSASGCRLPFVLLAPAPTLLVRAFSPTGSVMPGDVLTYTGHAQLHEQHPAHQRGGQGSLPGGTTYVAGSANAGGNTNASGEVVWYLGTNTAGTVGVCHHGGVTSTPPTTAMGCGTRLPARQPSTTPGTERPFTSAVNTADLGLISQGLQGEVAPTRNEKDRHRH